MALGQEPPSDNALVAAIGDQDREALSEIYRRHGGAVWSVAKRVCRSAELAKDVCQTVFTELWTRPDRFDPSRSGLRPWLVAQAHSRAVDAARAHKASRRQGRNGREADPTPPSAEVEVAAHVGSLAKEARRAFDQLATVERDAILLAYLGGHTSMETARLLGAPETTVKSHVRQGLMNLRRTLQTEGVSR